jgi:hypothetical protein
MIEEALEDLRNALAAAFGEREIRAQFSWTVGGRAVSEIGGRLLEDFALNRIAQSFSQLHPRTYESVEVTVPSSGRSIEDFRVDWSAGGSKQVLLVDVKGHNELRRGSRPNLASIRKCIELYGDPARAREEIVIFFCRYKPNIAPGDRAHDLTYRVMSDSFGLNGIFLLRNLSAANLDPANIGSGGQILLAREDRIVLEDRTRSEFVSLLEQLRGRSQRRPPADFSTVENLET